MGGMEWIRKKEEKGGRERIEEGNDDGRGGILDLRVDKVRRA